MWSLPQTAANTAGNALADIINSTDLCLVTPPQFITYIHSVNGTRSF